LCILVGFVGAQYPHYVQITSEDGLPSNEVYSLVEDTQGFIWMGCDAGLFKYDGIRFIPFKNENLQSKSITGLTLSKLNKSFSIKKGSYVAFKSIKSLLFSYSLPFQHEFSQCHYQDQSKNG
jgi:hypothetical protein